MRWYGVIGMCWIVLSSLNGCAPKVYERHAEIAYTAEGKPRAGYLTLNAEFLDALNEDLQACYHHK